MGCSNYAAVMKRYAENEVASHAPKRASGASRSGRAAAAGGAGNETSRQFRGGRSTEVEEEDNVKEGSASASQQPAFINRSKSMIQ